MITKAVVALLPVALVLIASELLWRKKILKGERARKFIHILAGVWIAFWPFYIPFDGIFILASMMLTLTIYSRVTNLFHAIYAVKRKTYGDVFYAVGLLVCAYFGKADWIFMISILFLALADGGAAVVGRYWGRKNEYFVFGSQNLRKSVAGTATFLMLAILSVYIGYICGGEKVMSENIIAVFLILPVLAALSENILPYGLDNLSTPLITTLLLNSLL